MWGQYEQHAGIREKDGSERAAEKRERERAEEPVFRKRRDGLSCKEPEKEQNKAV